MQKQVRKSGQTNNEKLEDINLSGAKTDSDVDSLLDEIDNVLEKDAQSFVSEFRQRGGE